MSLLTSSLKKSPGEFIHMSSSSSGGHRKRRRRRRRTIKPVPVGRPLLENSRKKRDRFFLEKSFPIFSKRLSRPSAAYYVVVQYPRPTLAFSLSFMWQFASASVPLRLPQRPRPPTPEAITTSPPLKSLPPTSPPSPSPCRSSRGRQPQGQGKEGEIRIEPGISHKCCATSKFKVQFRNRVT